MKLDCEVIRDLLPLYCEDIASEKSRELVEEHCKECVECSKKMQRMQEDEIVIEDDGKNLKDMMRKMRANRNAIIAVYCYIAAVIVSLVHGMHPLVDPDGAIAIAIIYNFMLLPIVSFGCSLAIASHKLWVKYLAPIVCGFYSMAYQYIIFENPIRIEPVLFMFGFIPSLIGVIVGCKRLKKNDFGNYNEGMIVGIAMVVAGVLVFAANPIITLAIAGVGAMIYFISWVTRVR